MPKFIPRYSQKLSSSFWEAIHSLPDDQEKEMFFAGVLLQNMEESVLKALNEYIREQEAQKERILWG